MASSRHNAGRRLAAVLAADVVGFSALMGQDEEGTLARIKWLRAEIIEPRVDRHRGRIVKTTGDGFLIELGSPVEAVRCAVEIQEALAGEAGPATQPALRLRMGINLGDIIIDEDGDIYGDGVNVAARLEQIASPGSICISGKVHEEVAGKLPYLFEDRGERRVKNIARPVRVFEVEPAPPCAGGDPARPTLPLPDKPSITVLPFTNMTADPAQEFFADGMTEDIITGLSRLRWLFVIARNSSFVYKGKPVDVRTVARELGVRYVLEGSVRASGNRIRVTGQLIDAERGKHIWAERYDRLVEDVFAVQDEITGNVVAAIEPHLYAEEGLRARSRPPESIDAWGLVVSAMSLIRQASRRGNDKAQRLLLRAIGIEPGYARAYAMLSWAKWWETFCYWRPGEGGFDEMEALATRALALDPDEPWARMIMGFALSTAGHHDRALEQLQGALELNPSWALGRTIYGVVLLRAGRPEEAVAETGKAVRMSPLDAFAGIYTAFHGLTLLGNHRFAEALPFLRRSVLTFPEFPGHYHALISCCGHLGRIDEASTHIRSRNRMEPPVTLGLLRRSLRHYAHCELFIDGMAKSGVPES